MGITNMKSRLSGTGSFKNHFRKNSFAADKSKESTFHVIEVPEKSAGKYSESKSDKKII